VKHSRFVLQDATGKMQNGIYSTTNDITTLSC